MSYPRLLLGLVLSVFPAWLQAKTIWLAEPATRFTESSPLGNGRLGAMLFGGVSEERIVLNESGMWSGSPQEADRPGAAEALPEIRRLLLAGKNAEAEKLVNERFTCAGPGSGRGRGANVPYGSYQLLGDLRLKFLPAEGKASASWTNYRRELDLETATARIQYDVGDVHFEREGFVSAPDEVFVLRLKASKPGMISFEAELARSERAAVEAVDANDVLLAGGLNDGAGGENVRFAARLSVDAKGGKVSRSGTTLTVQGADEAVLLVTAATDIKSFAGRKVADVRKTAAADLAGAKRKKFDALRKAHVADYQKWFGRASLELRNPDDAATKLSMPARLKAFDEGAADPGLAALYFDFGRYLLISSSRPGGLPANLQGIWADTIDTPWNGDWHLNINVQMNYWLAEVGNLSELHEPMFALIESLRAPGAKTAKMYYGARGWVAHVITNPWGFTSPGESAQWGSTSSGSAWLCTHLWEHYRFTGDKEFLRRVYPTLKGSSEFYLDILLPEPKNGWLVTAPSNSPENSFRMADGTEAHICLGATIDEQLVREVFTATIEAARVLGIDADLAQELETKRAKLAPTRVGSDGRVMEWLEEYAEPEPHHRHVSHLWGLYPGHEIDPRRTPELAAAARKTLEARGDQGTGWGTAFKLGMWARLGDGERCAALLRAHLQPAKPAEKPGVWTGGIYPNLFGAHPPFQIDGNLGGPAVIAEMLVQSTGSEIRLLPALPKSWPSGKVHGLRARGGFEVSCEWNNGRLTRAEVRSVGGEKTSVVYGEQKRELNLQKGEVRTVKF